MLFTLFWMAYEAWQAAANDPKLGELMVRLLDAAEARPPGLGLN